MLGSGLPHARGGVSFGLLWRNRFLLSSPRTWGCFQMRGPFWTARAVFPTHVGVFPFGYQNRYDEYSLPHARGGVSFGLYQTKSSPRSSPRTWGCFQRGAPGPSLAEVFPTHVGVFPLLFCLYIVFISLPHARGGVSCRKLFCLAELLSSPRTWGCFFSRSIATSNLFVFPTHVGVFLRQIRP